MTLSDLNSVWVKTIVVDAAAEGVFDGVLGKARWNNPR
jgi:hypothetical protein